MAQPDNGISGNDSSHSFAPGRLVEVKSRMWPGMNKPGGVARVSMAHFGINKVNVSHVDVHFVVGRGKEKRVPIEYVTPAPQYESRSTAGRSTLRDRSMLLGRCRRCGSLRTDCGSCDWAAMEQQVGQEDQQSTEAVSEEMASKRGQHSGRASSKSIDRRSLGPENTPPVVDASSDEDELLLQEMVAQNKRRYRRYLKEKARWARFYSDDASSSSSQESSEDEEEDSGRAVLSKSKDGSSKVARKRKKLSARSVLETFERHEVTSSRKKGLAIREKRKGKDGRSKEQSKSLHKRKCRRQRIDNTSNIDETFACAVDSSSESSMEISGGKLSSDEEENYPHQLRQSTSLERTNENIDGGSNYLMSVDTGDADNDARISLSQFIQPEGDEAAQNLPEDINDRTKSLQYRELPQFFDNMAATIEDDLVPNAKIKIAELQRSWAVLQRQTKPVTLRRINDDKLRNQRLAVAKQCDTAWTRLTQTLIRDGTDQCRAAIRSMMDDRLYRKNKKSLSPIERKQCRGAGMLDMRNLRMDALEDLVEDLFRKLRGLRDDCRSCEEGGLFADETVDTSSFCSADDDDEQSGESFPMTCSFSRGEDDLVLQSDQRALPPFRPHIYASRVRNSSSFAKSRQKRFRDAAIDGGDGKSNKGRHVDASCSHRQAKVVTRQAKGKLAKKSTVSEQISSCEESESSGSHTSKLDQPIARINESVDILRNARSKNNRRRAKCDRLQVRHPSSTPIESGFGVNRRPIAERMQAFLDANSQTDPANPWTSESRVESRFVKRRCEQAKDLDRDTAIPGRSSVPALPDQGNEDFGLQQVIRDKEVDSGIPDTSTDLIDAGRLYRDLRKKVECGHRLPSLQPVGDFKLLCENLRVNYPHSQDRCNTALEGILSFFEEGMPRDMSVRFLTIAFDILHDHGVSTLQELITCQSPILGIHIHLLVVCLRALELRLQERLGPNDGSAFVLFSTNKRSFVQYLVLQLADSAYAILHPDAWALQLDDRNSALSLLAPLRDAIARVTSLTETFCRCISEDLGCQEWRKGQAGDHVFVSSLNPSCWTSFIRNGNEMKRPQTTRLSALGKHLPRVEAETLWKLLAFVGASNSIPAEAKSIVRWQLISKLFSTVLQNENAKDGCPPLRVNNSQVSSCQSELFYLVSLLTSSALDNLPSTDGILKNIIQRSLNIQSGAFLSAYNTTEYSLLHDAKSRKHVVGTLWEATHPTYFNHIEDSAPVLTSMPFPGSMVEFSPIQSLVLPPTPILRCCTSLLSVWIQRVPLKKARQCRLSKTIEELVRYLLNLSEQAGSDKGDSFETIFSLVGHTQRPHVFFREAASYLRMVAILSKTQDQANSEIFTKSVTMTKQEQREIWNLLADDGMKKVSTSDLPQYSGTELFPLVTARVMTFLTLIQVGVSPWYLIGVSDTMRLPVEHAPGEEDPDTLVFPVGCIFTCLGCLCDIGCEPWILRQMYSFIAVIYSNALASLASDGLHAHLRSSILHLGRVSPPRFLKTLTRCFHLCTNGPEHDNAQFRLLLTALRGLISLAAKCETTKSFVIQKTPPIVEQTCTTDEINPAVDDVWGDLDDDVFASMDLGDTRSPDTLEVSRELGEVWKSLSQSIEFSKPSKRFAALQPTDFGRNSEAAMMTVSGKSLVARNIDRICECLSVIVALDKDDTASLGELFGNLLKQFTGVAGSTDDDGDAEYAIRTARYLCSSLCALSKEFQNCKSVLQVNFKHVAFSLVQSLADTGNLEGFPSCNLRRITENGGDQAAQRSWALLAIAKSEITHSERIDLNMRRDLSTPLARLQRKRRKSADEVWTFCHYFRLARCDSEPMANFATLDGDDSFEGLDLATLEMGSLEMEYLERFHILCAMISGQSDASFFEQISSLAVGTSASQALKIAQSLLYHDRACSGEKRKDPRRAKLVELLSTSLALTIGLFSYIIRETRCRGSEKWESFLGKIRDLIVASVSQHQRIDYAVALAKIIEASRSIFYGSEPRPIPLNAFASISGYVGENFMIRSRHLNQILTSQEQGSQGFVNSLLTGFLGSEASIAADTAWVIASSFQMDEGKLQPRRPQDFHSPLEMAINEYLGSLWSSNGNGGGRGTLNSLKNHAVNNYLIPRLNHSKTNHRSRMRALLLVSYIYESDKMSNVSLELSAAVLGNLCLLARGICKCLRQSFAAELVDNDFAAELFVCAAQMTAIRLSSANEAVTSIIRWSRENCEPDDMSELSALSLTTRHAYYLWIFFRWMCEVGKLVAEFGDKEKKQHMISFRETCRKNQTSDLIRNKDELVAMYENLMNRLEEIVFPERRENNPGMTNVYAKDKDVPEHPNDVPMECWSPSGNMVRRAKEFIAEVIPLCYEN